MTEMATEMATAAGRKKANALEAMWRAGDERLAEERRREVALDWFSHYCHLAEVYRKRAEHFERLAETLCGEG